MCNRDSKPSRLPQLMVGGPQPRLATLPGSAAPPNGRRLRTWQMRDHVECSVIGTCLSQADLQTILAKCRLKAAADLPAYDLHAYFVEAVRRDGPVARAVQKLLDRRHEGILRIVGRTEDPTELGAIWDREQAAGRIPGAYWALQTHSHVPQGLHKRVFGEVHMLSHVLGRTVHATAERASELASRIADLERHLHRQAERHADALAVRDAELDRLRRKLVATSATPRVWEPRVARARVRHDKRDRALSVARERARMAEARAAALMSENSDLRERLTRLRVAQPADGTKCPGVSACRVRLRSQEPLRVLYLGGRTGSIEQLREIARSASAEFHHHDGGREQAFARIGELIERCHVVFCPVDCINHRACLLAKHHCQRARKAFVPLRSSGGSTFREALRAVAVDAE